jgi:hypothetical protein
MTHQTIGQLFETPPATWGLRGDPFLWQAMQQHFSATLLPENSDDLIEQLENAFQLLTLHSIKEDAVFFAKEFAVGGMSSGNVMPKFWRENAVPFLVARFTVLRGVSEKRP